MRGALNDDALPNALLAHTELHSSVGFFVPARRSSAEELFTRALICGYEALAITDEY